MAQAYKAASERVVLFDNEPINERSFELILINPLNVKYDAEHETVEDILDADITDAATKNERIALRTQVIDNPLQPVNIGTKILQFFAVNPNQDSIARDERRNAAILLEKVEGEDTPLFYINPDELWSLAHGDGFATSVLTEALAPAVTR